MLDFTINNLVFLSVFGGYLAFFVLVYGVSHALSLLRSR